MLLLLLYCAQNLMATYVIAQCRGTLPYMAPELVSDPERVSEKADVWSLGMVLWEMLTRQVPFTHLTPQQIIAGLMGGKLQPEVSTAKAGHKQQSRNTFTSYCGYVFPWSGAGAGATPMSTS